MPTTDDLNDLRRVDEYWEIVKRTFRDVLQQQHSDPVDALRKTIAGRPTEEQLLLYHREPLYTAADIAGVPVDDRMLSDYLRMTDKLGWSL